MGFGLMNFWPKEKPALEGGKDKTPRIAGIAKFIKLAAQQRFSATFTP
jgi:hypothetical protein